MVRPIAFMGRLVRRQNDDEDRPTTVVLPGGITLTRGTSTTTSTTTSTRPTVTSSSTTTSSSTSTSTSTSASASTSLETEPETTSTTTTSTSTSTTTTPTPTPSTTSSESILVVSSQTQNQQLTTTESAPPTTTVVIENQTVTTTPKTSDAPTLPERAGAAKSSSFLDNKVAAGVVFGLSGLVGLILIFVIVWFAMRKRRRNARLEKEIISFDPNVVGKFNHHPGQYSDADSRSINSLEKGNIGRSNSSLDHYAGNGYAATMNVDHSGDYRNATPYSDYGVQRNPSLQRNGSLQRPGNAAFNPTGNSDGDFTRAYGQMPSRTYAMPSQTYNR